MSNKKRNKLGRFDSKLTDKIINDIISKMDWLLEDVVSYLKSEYGVDPRTAVSWFMQAQREELKRRS